jgi:hypothetical protein
MPDSAIHTFYRFSAEFTARFTEFRGISVFVIPVINVLYCGAQVGVGLQPAHNFGNSRVQN